jgi:hypothetical protein
MGNPQADKRGLFGLAGRKPGAAGPSDLSPKTPAPVLSDAAQLARDLPVMRMNQRALAAAAARGPVRYATVADAALELVGVQSRAAVVADITRPGFAYWCDALQCFVRPQRKLWEFAAVLQAFYEAGVLTPGARMLGLGVGDEPIPSYLASLGLDVVATDLPGVTDRERVWRQSMLEGDAFDRRVEVSDVDIRRLDDPTLRGFDGLWSCSVVNALASADAAAEAIVAAMDTLKPGGVAVHATEFAFADDQPPQTPGSLFFPRRFFQSLADGLNGRGHQVAPVSFDLGQDALDGYVDLEPYTAEGAETFEDLWREGLGCPHLKVMSGGVLTTSFALVIRARL